MDMDSAWRLQVDTQVRISRQTGVFCHYDKSRGGKVAREALDGFSGR